MKHFYNPPQQQWDSILERPAQAQKEIELTVSEIFSEIKSKGDIAVKRYTQLFDGVECETFRVSEERITQSERHISPQLKEAIALAKTNITKFHAAQKTERIFVETCPGVSCWQEKRAIEKVGLYIPGGSAPLFSTILMLAVPAVLAGCKQIVLCTPPNKQGEVHPAILYTAGLCGISEIFTVGGIQAIGAMTFGTDTIPNVYKIFGPGNQYVTAAKQMATSFGIAIDMPAGPSELLVFADQTANPSFVAADLLSQAEHGADSQVVLVTTSQAVMEQVEEAVTLQLAALPRKAIALKALENSKLILVDSNENALQLINRYSPEHFIVIAEDETFFIQNIMNAGSVFIGNYTPESAGDYASGTNHTLPTNGYARQYSGVNLDSFYKSMTFQKISKEGIKVLGSAIEEMAAAEGLQAHKNAVTIRLKSLEDER
ncbi:histidinol dehydrogenase [Altibacter sp.]|uniref:histidinol dehydrogenase n=1 Tax=Altibacter sp. TaxID=2024823 RepID=UPI000C8FA86D|nr:histidinol dehydrogenase [Altibacter sp.]MAP54879.1 histidinol dehydrogenase [Altibacter sp.]